MIVFRTPPPALTTFSQIKVAQLFECKLKVFLKVETAFGEGLGVCLSEGTIEVFSEETEVVALWSEPLQVSQCTV